MTKSFLVGSACCLVAHFRRLYRNSRTGKARILRISASLWRSALLGRSMDRTAEICARRTLVVAPHPDDETLGCGATIARARAEGAVVRIVVVTDGSASTESAALKPEDLAAMRRTELEQATAILGVDAGQLHRLEFLDGGASAAALPIAEALRRELLAFRPQQVFIPLDTDAHPDHVAVHRAVMSIQDALPQGCALLGYPVWAWAQGPWFLGVPTIRRARLRLWAVWLLAGRHQRVSTDGLLAVKQAAMNAYRSQISNVTGESTWRNLPKDFVEKFMTRGELFLDLRTPRRVAARRRLTSVLHTRIKEAQPSASTKALSE